MKFKIGDVVILSDYSEFQDQKDWFPGIIDNFLKNNDEFTYQVKFSKDNLVNGHIAYYNDEDLQLDVKYANEQKLKKALGLD